MLMNASTSPPIERIEAGEATDLLPKTRLRNHSNRLSTTTQINVTIATQSPSAVADVGWGSRASSRSKASMVRPPGRGVGGRRLRLLGRLLERFNRSATHDLRLTAPGGYPLDGVTKTPGAIAPPTMRAPFLGFHKRTSRDGA